MTTSLHFKDLRDIYFCTGARNHDLLELILNPLFELDERVASFKALGHAKMGLGPGSICTTSGTAVAECIPAMLEAFYSNLPLILITGDRPKKQHGTGAPQTLHHEELTRSCRRSYFEIELKDLSSFSVTDVLYPLHLNVIVDDTISHNESVKESTEFGDFLDFLKAHSRPLFLFSHEEKGQRELVEKFSQLGIPFYAETLSGAHDLSTISSEAELLDLFKENAFDSVIRIGHTPLSKLWRLLETRLMPVVSFDSRNLSALSYGLLFPFSGDWLMGNTEWWKAIEKIQGWETTKTRKDKNFINGLCEKYANSEQALISKTQSLIPEGAAVYLGNSLIIRNFETTQTKRFRVFGNRGVNGIDGQLSTAIGMARVMDEKLYCFLGDLTLRYDLGAMADIPQNLHVVIINNKGGRIFESLNLDPRIILSHEKNFQGLAQAFSLSYSRELKDFSKVQLLELITDLEAGRQFQRELKS